MTERKDKFKYLRLGVDVTELAEKIGCHKTYLYGVLSGCEKASPRLALKIERATKGKIRAKELRPDIESFMRWKKFEQET